VCVCVCVEKNALSHVNHIGGANARVLWVEAFDIHHEKEQAIAKKRKKAALEERHKRAAAPTYDVESSGLEDG
jgi:hypothetical protein